MIRSRRQLHGTYFAACFLVAFAVSTFAQPTTNLPIVRIRAIDSFASESGNPGTFTVSRDGGGTNSSLDVLCRIGGTASNGVDYVALSNIVTIPAGAFAANVIVTPIDDALVEGPETVELQLIPPPTANAPTYLIGSPSNAVVTIFDNDAGTNNLPPSVLIVIPTNGASFAAPASINICAEARDLDGYVATVEFFAGTHSLGIRTNNPMSTSPINPFCLTWSNVPQGNYMLTAKATDDRGAMTVSDPIQVFVGAPITNHPPFVHLNSPLNGAFFLAPVNIELVAYAQDVEDGTNLKVEFFAGTNSLGLGTFVPSLCPAPYCPDFVLIWSNVPPGNYVLTARATDTAGLSSTSDPAHISVTTTSAGPVVTIIATDPNASEGPISASNGTNTGTFTVFRTDQTNTALIVNYMIGGTASNGADYVAIPGSVLIPTGAFSAKIVIQPIDDNLVEGTETVVLTLLQPPYPAIFPPPPERYLVGSPSTAVVFIEDNDRITNAPPKVHITSPTNGTVFAGPVDITITAEAADVDDEVARVDFFANDHFLGTDAGTNKTPYSIVWSNALPGLYALHARAFDSRGAVGFSDPVRITVTGTNPPPTNLPPVITIFASDPIASEGTNFCRWYSNSTGILPYQFPCTNTATFVVRRTGPTNHSLTINYAIGGSASNGVDYVAIPGSVTIPAGEHSARITIVPIDDTIPECTETVILGVLQPTNLPPEYLVGWPGKAAAIIVDNDQPPPATTTLCDGTFHLIFPAPTGFNYRIECSLDMVHWVTIGTNTVSDVDVHFAEAESQGFPNRFYRVIPEANPPLQ